MNAPSGIRNNKIPQSRRPDGSLRKAIKIRPGFIPAEDQVKYTPLSRIPVETCIVGSSVKEPEMSKAALKNLKRNNKKKEKELKKEEFFEKDTEKNKSEQKTRAVLKKLRQIEELEKKPFNSLTKEQLDKLEMKAFYIKELDELKPPQSTAPENLSATFPYKLNKS